MSYLGSGPGRVYLPPPGKSLDYSQLNDATTAALMGLRNRAINGDFRVAQRATSFTGTPNGYNTVDRFGCSIGTGSGHTVGQVLDGPPGFQYCYGVTIGTGAAPAAGAFNGLWHNIEGYNVSDLKLGSANGLSSILSFNVKASIPGNYAVSFMNGALNRNYIARYTINAANTWEAKSILLPPDTTGTWEITTNIGLSIAWDFGCGSNFETSLGAWGAGQRYRYAAAVKLVATSGATFRVTGVQLEQGSIATPYQLLQITDQFAYCQRYYEIVQFPNDSRAAGGIAWANSTPCSVSQAFKVTKRVNPTATELNAGTQSHARQYVAGVTSAFVQPPQNSSGDWYSYALVAGFTSEL